jgi:HSP20 family protein
MTKTTSVPVRQDTSPGLRERSPMPWSRLGTLRDEIDRMFGDFNPGAWFESPFALPATTQALMPAMDLTENGSSYAVSLELPGIDPAKVEVKLTNGTLVVSGEKEEQTTDEGEDYHVSERRWGSFRRMVRLPDHVDQDRIEAQFSNGVLKITLPKTAAAKAAEKTIEVKAA